MKKEVEKLGCDSSKIEVIHGGIDLSKIPFKLRKTEPNTVKILSAGRFVEKKGFDILIHAFRELKKQFTDARLTIIGQGKLQAELHTLVKESDLESHVEIKPNISHDDFIQELSATNHYSNSWDSVSAI